MPVEAFPLASPVCPCVALSLCGLMVSLSVPSTLEHLKRWLQPDKVAISSEEVQCLIPPESQPEKLEGEEEPPAAEQ